MLGPVVRRLRAAGVAEPEREAVMLVALALGVPVETLYRDRPTLDAAQRGRLDQLAQRRARREPMAYLRGHQEFFGFTLQVTPAVLIPRPETEVLVETALEEVPPTDGTVVDVGTGSGAVALALALRGPAGWDVVGVDNDPAALGVAEANRAALHADRVRLLRSDLLAEVPGPLLAVVANLPYVGEGDEVDPEVRQEPYHAVYAARGGLSLIAALIPQAAERLGAGGVLALEIGRGQEAAVQEMMEKRGFSGCRMVADAAGIPRVIWGRWHG